jgi:hypothetical protein
MSYALRSRIEPFAVPFVVVNIVDLVDDVSAYVAAEAVFCVVTEVPVAVSLSDEPLLGYAISV